MGSFIVLCVPLCIGRGPLLGTESRRDFNREAQQRDVLSAVRTAEERQSWQGRGLATSPVIERLMDRLDDAMAEAFEGCTLKGLADEDSAPAECASAQGK